MEFCEKKQLRSLKAQCITCYTGNFCSYCPKFPFDLAVVCFTWKEKSRNLQFLLTVFLGSYKHSDYLERLMCCTLHSLSIKLWSTVITCNYTFYYLMLRCSGTVPVAILILVSQIFLVDVSCCSKVVISNHPSDAMLCCSLLV